MAMVPPPPPGANRPCRDRLSQYMNAWADRRKALEDAHFTAVMGYALPRGTRQDGWTCDQLVTDDSDLESALLAATVGSSQEAVRDRYCEVQYIDTALNISDAMTKGLGSNKIRTFRPYLMGHEPLTTLFE